MKPKKFNSYEELSYRQQQEFLPSPKKYKAVGWAVTHKESARYSLFRTARSFAVSAFLASYGIESWPAAKKSGWTCVKIFVEEK